MTTGPHRKARQDVTRALVLAAARKHFTRHGYEGANIRHIAADAGRSTGAVFGNWPGGKEELFEAAMDRKAPMVVIKDILLGAALRGEVPALGDRAASVLLLDLYGEASFACISASISPPG